LWKQRFNQNTLARGLNTASKVPAIGGTPDLEMQARFLVQGLSSATLEGGLGCRTIRGKIWWLRPKADKAQGEPELQDSSKKYKISSEELTKASAKAELCMDAKVQL
jgi:hypothetical protein